MSHKPYGFVPSAGTPKKKELPPETAPNPEPKVVNNYFYSTNTYKLSINPQAILLVAILIVVMIVAFRSVPALRA